MHVTRRRFLHGVGMAGAAIRVGLPPLAAWFTTNGTAYAATAKPVAPRFVFWFNGNGIPERYWIPSEVGTGYELTPCLAPLKSLRDDIHIISSIDNAGAQVVGTRQWPSQVDQRRPLRCGLHRSRRRRRVDRSGDRGRHGRSRRGSTRCRWASARNRTARTSTAT